MASTTIDPYVGTLNLSNGTGITLFNEGSKSLTPKFNGSPKNLQPFLAELHTQAEECKWVGILTVADDGPVTATFWWNMGALCKPT